MNGGTPAWQRPRARRPSRAITASVVTIVLAIGSGSTVAACSGSETDPAQERLERVEERLRSSFSDTQARCIVERADPAVIRALDRTVDLDPDSELVTAYSDAVAACVTGPDGAGPGDAPTATTTPEPPTTTTSPPG